jgi:fructosamine-3-kinase/nicotinic acid mononucleotide adenylyltransferase
MRNRSGEKIELIKNLTNVLFNNNFKKTFIRLSMKQNSPNVPNNLRIIKRITRGRINDCYECFDENNNRKVFLKINESNDASLIQDIEYKNNKLFFEKGINVPIIYENKKSESIGNILIMEYLDFPENKRNQSMNSLEYKDITKLVESIKFIHSHKESEYGMNHEWINGKIIFSTKKSNSWLLFFKELWKTLIDHFIPRIKNEPKMMDIWIKSTKVYDVMHNILTHNPIPTLLHGDLNKSNYGIINDKVYFFDIQCFYGDPLYDVQCLVQWFDDATAKSIIDCYDPNIDMNIMKLYKTFIYLSIVVNSGNPFRPGGSFQKDALRSLDHLLSLYQPMYQSLIVTDHMKFENNNLCKSINSSCCSRKKIILVQGGSFNPVHKNHINNLKKALQFVQIDRKENEYCIKCIIVPATDNRIKSKCKNGIKLYDRYQMLRLVCEGTMIDLSQLYGTLLLQNYTNIFGIPSHSNGTPSCSSSNDVLILVVLGSDTLLYNYKNYPDTTKFIVVPRKDYQIEKEIKDNEKELLDEIKKSSRITYLLENDEVKMSSTVIRNCSLTIDNKNKNKNKNKILQYIEENVRAYYDSIKSNTQNKNDNTSS